MLIASDDNYESDLVLLDFQRSNVWKFIIKNCFQCLWRIRTA